MFRLPPDFRLNNLRELLRNQEESSNGGAAARAARPPPKKRYFPELAIEPEEAGVQLLNSGEFGCPSPPHTLTSSRRYPTSVRTKLMAREIGAVKRPRYDLGRHVLPNCHGRPAVRLASRAYCGQFSEDGSFFYTCSQDFQVRLFDTTDPTSWQHYKTIHGSSGRWTITDATLSPDNSKIAYSSITSTVHLASTTPDDAGTHDALDFGSRMSGYGGFGIWSLRFSGDGHEICAGATGGAIYVYDIEARKTVLGVTGHRDDVNAVCWADESTNVLFSGSDDSVIRVWDRRSMVDGRASGVLAGHLEGITFISPKKDGRYVLSNGKDQTTKLWDIRKLISEEQWDHTARVDYTDAQYDYREAYYRGSLYEKHPNDVSVMSYAGHAIVSTLIRCGFSAPATTGQQYVYSGSHCGRLFIWNLDGTLAKTLNLDKAQGRRPNVRKIDTDEVSRTGRYRGRENDDGSCIRDAAWHPSLPVIATTSWHSTGGAIYVHEFMEDHSALASQPPVVKSFLRERRR
ncbi:WD40-repeat-containing domain protein [Protomyces lactucae-debilis]|uniref:WD40-repeat-containing domain protein n=1 Tax=Protomyces lactucae-debilis TaxID=2754530 RepID=A0A1Y2EUS0_PROLT|nr:WD40-repeat-containing domain protein [Protomyces lactucae-debilis]ORY74595.1 WD40-repeat-containing domain protein [Protomyces lactucae-debilis]